ncbi:uncharacterized protein LOC111486736 isoform X3 [Cucurbita maxima]|uniref:Uncharacterized protein LOC111486736 isoform X3 n=1 Tax=Cucurbita maxima TaxID=3661 RepID=A0A6J1JR84_CUCMA|nr:uncharacterized protein LOC111486736 isoform X3 [Cucurbita maxima]
MDASKLDKKLLTKYLMENPHDNLPYFADNEDKDASNERIHSHHHHGRSLKVKVLIISFYILMKQGKATKQLLTQNLVPFSTRAMMWSEQMLIFLTHRGNHES